MFQAVVGVRGGVDGEVVGGVDWRWRVETSEGVLEEEEEEEGVSEHEIWREARNLFPSVISSENSKS